MITESLAQRSRLRKIILLYKLREFTIRTSLQYNKSRTYQKIKD